MTTVSTPGGTPSPTYNREGRTIQSVSGGFPNNQANATPIVHYSSHDIVLVDGSVHQSVILPDDAEIGDAVELYCTANSAQVWPQVGASIANHGTNTSITVSPGTGALLRLVAANSWQM